MSKTKIVAETKEDPRPDLAPNDPRVTAAIIKRIKEMSFEELQAQLAYREEGIIETEYPDPTPVTREELLRRMNSNRK